MVQLCRDTQMLSGDLLKTPLRKPDIELVFISEVKKHQKMQATVIDTDRGLSNSVDKLTYPSFLTCLMKLSTKLYPTSTSANGSVIESAFQQLLMENVLPLASRRSPKSIDSVLCSGEIMGLFTHFGPSLTKIFEFYAGEGVNTQRAKAGARGVKEINDFDDVKAESSARFARNAERSQVNKNGQPAGPNGGKAAAQNTMTNGLAYADFVRFAGDFGLTSQSSNLTMIDVGDIYLAGVANATGTASVRKLKFRDFKEVLVRIARQAYKKISVSDADKLRGLLLFMWRQIQSSISQSVSGNLSSSRSTHKGGLLRGAQMFNERFISMWQEDGYKDYLFPKSESQAEGRDVLSRLISGETLQSDMPPAPPLSASKKVGMRSKRSESLLSGNTFLLEVEEDDNSDLGDLGINPDRLKELLIRRPDLAAMLQKNLQEAGLAGSP
jgi:hypothetical protein